MGHAFISYSTKNQESANTIHDLFIKNGIATWMAPGDIPAGSNYAQVINKAIKECSCLVLILTNDSQNSVWVPKEVERAVNYRKAIIPVQFEDVVLNDEFEFYISTNQVIHFHKNYEESEAIRKVLSSVNSYISHDRACTSLMNQNFTMTAFSGSPIINPTLEMILKEVSEFYSIPVERIKGKASGQNVVLARQVAEYLMRDLCSMSLPEIGKVLNQHHTAVMYGIDRLIQSMSKNESLRDTVNNFKINLLR